MKFRRQARQDLDVNMTPLIDVVFLLLIFFMVSTTFTKESHIGIKLPKAQQITKAEVQSNHLQLVIDVNGTFKIDGQVLAGNDTASIKAAFRRWLTQRDSTSNKAQMTISADAGTAHQFVVTAMDIAGQLGFSKLSISTIVQEQQQ